jgi:nucleoside-diphosphate kinase
MNEQSLLLIKPNAVEHHHVGHIISMVEDYGFVLTNIKTFKFTRERAEEFYEMHRGKEFFERLVTFMCSGVTIAILLERQEAVSRLRELVGDADPGKRKPDTIRAMYADGVTENAVHASDSPEAASREISLVFS